MSNSCNDDDDGILMKEQEIATRCTKKKFSQQYWVHLNWICGINRILRDRESSQKGECGEFQKRD